MRKIQIKIEFRGGYCIRGDKGDKIMVIRHMIYKERVRELKLWVRTEYISHIFLIEWK